jgi:hypothetical protein
MGSIAIFTHFKFVCFCIGCKCCLRPSWSFYIYMLLFINFFHASKFLARFIYSYVIILIWIPCTSYAISDLCFHVQCFQKKKWNTWWQWSLVHICRWRQQLYTTLLKFVCFYKVSIKLQTKLFDASSSNVYIWILFLFHKYWMFASTFSSDT